MNRRLCVLRLGAALLTVPTWQAWAQGSAPTGLREGKDYLALRTPAPTDVPAGKVEVLEFFSYNCPHCAALEPSLEAWSKKLPADAVLRRVPVPFIGDAEVKQRLYYTLEAMGKLGELHGKVFDAIHRQRINLSGEKATLDWLAASTSRARRRPWTGSPSRAWTQPSTAKSPSRSRSLASCAAPRSSPTPTVSKACPRSASAGATTRTERWRAVWSARCRWWTR